MQTDFRLATEALISLTGTIFEGESRAVFEAVIGGLSGHHRLAALAHVELQSVDSAAVFDAWDHALAQPLRDLSDAGRYGDALELAHANLILMGAAIDAWLAGL